MSNINLLLKNNIKLKNLKVGSSKVLLKKFDRIFLEISKDIKQSKKTINVLDNKFKFNFEIKDLERFKKFKTIALIGMGGSILGAEAIHNFLRKKIKKKFIFLMILMKAKFQILKKMRIYQKFFILLFRNQATQ